MANDTIAAIASGMTASGIGIIRISGPEAFAVAGKICRLKKGRPLGETASHTIHYGVVTEAGGSEDAVIDEVLILKMNGPKTYTAEDTVEIDCHGGPAVMRRVLSAVLAAGARPAEPGEFTKRAFLNGRIDLSEAEAVMSLIEAKNDYAMKSAVRVLRGSVRHTVESMRALLLTHIARIEASLDDPEHLGLDEDIDDMDDNDEEVGFAIRHTADYLEPERMKAEDYRRALGEAVDSVLDGIGDMLAHYEDGRLLREGIKTVILGRPNAGKSSLLNLLTGEDRAIVTDIAGTTRDILEETVTLDGLTLLLTDTAGIRRTEEPVEKIGVEKARLEAEKADLLIYVADVTRPLDKDDEDILGFIKGRPAIILMNKTDSVPVITADELRQKSTAPVIPFSALTGDGLGELKAMIKDLFQKGEVTYNDEVTVASERQRQALTAAGDSLRLVRQSLADRMPEDFYAIDLTDAYASLGSVLGEDIGEDVVNEVFSRFCMGK